MPREDGEGLAGPAFMHGLSAEQQYAVAEADLTGGAGFADGEESAAQDLAPGQRRVFRHDMFTSSTLADYQAHHGQEVTVLRAAVPEDGFDDENLPQWHFRADDGWEGCAYPWELAVVPDRDPPERTYDDACARAAGEAVARHSEILLLEEGSGPAVDLWHLIRSLLLWSDSKGVDFDEQLSLVRQDFAQDKAQAALAAGKKDGN